MKYNKSTRGRDFVPAIVAKVWKHISRSLDATTNKQLFIAGIDWHTMRGSENVWNNGERTRSYRNAIIRTEVKTWLWCTRCGFGWKPHQNKRTGAIKALPKRCPHCVSRDWWKPYVYTTEDITHRGRACRKNNCLTGSDLTKLRKEIRRRANAWDEWATEKAKTILKKYPSLNCR